MGTATSSPVYTTPPRLVGSFIKRVGAAPSPVRVHARNGGVSVNKDDDKEIVCQAQVQAQGPYCILVGPVDSASQETLEALYRQARDAYYSGTPLIVDDMFDRVELKLRRYGSKYVVKYPRCSLRQQSTYADAEEYLPQAFALATIWVLFLAFGSSACFLPVFYVFGLAYQDAVDSGLLYYSNQTHVSEFFAMLNGTFFMVLGSMIGYPIALASVRVLQGLWRNDLVALKGSCPNCGEEVFAFVRSDQSNSSPHRVDCHVCESILEFRTKTEQSLSRLGRRWVYGRVYLVSLGGRNRRQRRISDLT